MDGLSNDLWLFDYDQGLAYEEFSKSQDLYKTIDKHLIRHYDFRRKTVLEIGAGSGKFTALLSEMSSKLYVVEKSASLMEINCGKNSNNGNTEFILSDLANLNMRSNSVDVIFAGWSLTSMRDSFDIIFDIFRKILRKDGCILIIEHAGNDEFCRIMDICEFTSKMRSCYIDAGFIQKKVIDTVIRLECEDIFYNSFPGKKEVRLGSLDIQHKVLVLEMQASVLYGQKTN